MLDHYNAYIARLQSALVPERAPEIERLALSLKDAWENKKQVFICGNGGSAGNAIHLANDFNYGIDKKNGLGLRIEALPANAAVITCLANDEGYDSIYSQQLEVKANPGDVLIVLSGSGNSPNVVKALEVGNRIGMITYAILGFSGGKCKELAKHPIHFPINDMQISEDLQVIVGHMCMQWLCEAK
ncbi:SIS domain protein [Leptospira weilii serovar Ranarum str. ICFT]|uniref:SIS domain protein n=1 Tax=Leptospira weilii serovar Ranarum str. ICFT TaxID=1218598 RepID=N1WBP0_9LEPT|nr:SIS domain-containing protein [Leptospira weilii]EMY76345.1 SIS domain protein [Leptospira weilii serovar Ranarum str. ICFT]